MTAPPTRIEAFFSDLDGTFWSPTTKIHQNSIEVVELLDQHSIPFVIATGRRAKGSYHGLAPYGLGDRPAILMNGAIVRNRLDVGESLAVTSIDNPHPVLAEFERAGLEPALYIDHPTHDMIVGPNTAAADVYLNTTIGFERVPQLSAVLDDSTVVGFGAFGFEYDLLQPIEAAINDSGHASAVIGVSHIEGGHGIMVQPANVDKAVGIGAWCEANGVDPNNVAVIGDGHNDIEMLEAAAIAIVPDNAPPEILAVADATIPPNEIGGWEEIPRILGLA